MLLIRGKRLLERPVYFLNELVVPRRLSCFIFSTPLAIEELAPTQPESSTRGASAAVPVTVEPASENARVKSPWPRSIQHLVLAMTRTIFLLEESYISILIAKNALRPENSHRLNEVEMDDLYDNIIHSAIETVLCAYIAKKRN